MVRDASENGGPSLIAVTTVFLVLGWLSVSSRTAVRIFLSGTFAVDDWLMIVALVCFLPIPMINSASLTIDS